MNGLFRGSVRVTAIVGAGALLAALITGCGAGQVTQTGTKKVSAIGGVNVDRGNIAIRDAYLVAPPETTWTAGSNAPLSLRLVNRGRQADTLISISSAAATAGVQLAPADQPTVAAAEPNSDTKPSVSPSASQSPPVNSSAAPSATPSASPSAAPSKSPVASQQPGTAQTPVAVAQGPANWQPVELQPNVLVILTPKAIGARESDSTQWTSQIVLLGLKTQLRSGQKIAITLQFERAGKITFKLPVSAPAQPRARQELPKSENHDRSE